MCLCSVGLCVCVCVVWACSHAQVCRRTALTQAGAVCVCVCVCVCVVRAYSYEPVCRGTALTQAGARTRSAIPLPALLAPALPFSLQWDGPKVRLGFSVTFMESR